MEQEASPAERVLFTYMTEHLGYTDKVRFYYALKGRDGKGGIVVDAHVEQLGKTVLLVPKEHAQSVEEFLKFWKCAYARRRVVLYA